MSRSFQLLLIAGAIAVTSTTAASAGGFSRGRADTDVIYEKGNFDARFTATYVMPSRKYATIDGVAATDGAYTNSYFLPSFGAKVGFSENLSCAVTYAQPFGGSASYGTQAYTAGNDKSGNGTKAADLKSAEIGGLCAVSVNLGPGRASFIGGIFQQNLSYKEVTKNATLDVTDSGKTGYRIGAAYAIDEYALRAEVMYRSQIDNSLTGTLKPTPGGSFAATASATMPQSVRVSLQSGVAPDWLVYGSVEWTQWSVFKTLSYKYLTTTTSKVFNYRDGWTVQAGVGHKFSDTVSGTLNLTWDRGVGTGNDISTDTWTVGTGASIKAGPGDLRLGAGISYLTAGSQFSVPGKTYAATADGNWAVGVTGSYLIKF